MILELLGWLKTNHTKADRNFGTGFNINSFVHGETTEPGQEQLSAARLTNKARSRIYSARIEDISNLVMKIELLIFPS